MVRTRMGQQVETALTMARLVLAMEGAEREKEVVGVKVMAVGMAQVVVEEAMEAVERAMEDIEGRHQAPKVRVAAKGVEGGGVNVWGVATGTVAESRRGAGTMLHRPARPQQQPLRRQLQVPLKCRSSRQE